MDVPLTKQPVSQHELMSNPTVVISEGATQLNDYQPERVPTDQPQRNSVIESTQTNPFDVSKEGIAVLAATVRRRGEGHFNLPPLVPTLTQAGREELARHELEADDQTIFEGLTPPIPGDALQTTEQLVRGENSTAPLTPSEGTAQLTAAEMAALDTPEEMIPDARRQVRITERRSDMWITHSEHGIGQMTLKPTLEAIQKLSEEKKWSAAQIDAAKKSLTEIGQKLNITLPSIEVVVQDQFGVAAAMLTELMKNIDQRSQTHYLDISGRGNELSVIPHLPPVDVSVDPDAQIREEEDYADFVFALNQFIGDLNHALEDTAAFVHIPTEDEGKNLTIPSYADEEQAQHDPQLDSRQRQEADVAGSGVVRTLKGMGAFFKEGLKGVFRGAAPAEDQLVQESEQGESVDSLVEILLSGNEVVFPQADTPESQAIQRQVESAALASLGLNEETTPIEDQNNAFILSAENGALIVRIEPSLIQARELQSVQGERAVARKDKEILQSQYNQATQALDGLLTNGSFTFDHASSQGSIAVQDIVLDVMNQVLEGQATDLFEPVSRQDDRDSATLKVKEEYRKRLGALRTGIAVAMTRRQAPLGLTPSFT